MKTYLDLACEMSAHEEIRNLTPEEWGEEFLLTVRDYLNDMNGLEEPDSFANEEHDATAERARKHRRALVKDKKGNWELRAVKDKTTNKRILTNVYKPTGGHKSYKYTRDGGQFFPEFVFRDQVKSAEREFMNQMKELYAEEEELPNIFEPTFADYLDTEEAFRYLKARDDEKFLEPEIEIDPDDLEFRTYGDEVWTEDYESGHRRGRDMGYEKGREDGYKAGYEAGYKAAREEFFTAFAKMTASSWK